MMELEVLEMGVRRLRPTILRSSVINRKNGPGWLPLSSINNLLQHHHHTIPFQVIFGDISNKSWFKFKSCNFLNLRQLQLSGDKVGQCSILDRQTVHFTIINILTSKYVKLGVCIDIKFNLF